MAQWSTPSLYLTAPESQQRAWTWQAQLATSSFSLNKISRTCMAGDWQVHGSTTHSVLYPILLGLAARLAVQSRICANRCLELLSAENSFITVLKWKTVKHKTVLYWKTVLYPDFACQWGHAPLAINLIKYKIQNTVHPMGLRNRD